jgi:hypothetical protein
VEYPRLKLIQSRQNNLHYRVLTSALVLCLLAATVRAFPSTFLSQPRVPHRGDLTVAKVVENVRKAIRYDKIRKLKYGFVVEEIPSASNNSNGFVYTFGKAGRVRREGTGQNRNPFIFDGKDGWSIDQRTELAFPNSQSGGQKLLFPAWIRSGWWLDKNAPLSKSILAGESDEKTVALAMKFDEGGVGAKLFINRETWLPAKLVVEYAAGPYIWELSDYQESLGFLYPRQIKTNYRNSDSVYKVKSVAENSSDKRESFVGFNPPANTTFDNNAPAELKSAKGEGEGAHYFVRPLVDGKEVGPFNFDSGYFGLTIDARIADELGMPVVGTTRITGNDGNVQNATLRRGKTFQLGRLVIKEPIYMATDLSGRSATRGEKRAGVCGYPIFARSVVEFHQGGERISIYDPSTYRLPKGKWQELFYALHGPGVYARLEGDRRGFFLLDTGGSVTVFFFSPYIKEHGLLRGRRTSELVGEGSGGGTLKSLVGELQWFELAGHRFINPSVEFSIEGEGVEEGDISGVIGREFMKHFETIVFNFPAKRIAFIE